MREVFIDAVKANNIPIMRCMFEADDEIAILSRKLNCPVLSYDSDFYIHNVQYIPYVTITHKIYRKTIFDEKNYEIEIVGNVTNKNKKKSAANKKNKKVTVGEMKKETVQEIETYNYLDCSIYTVENLIDRKSLRKEMLPLFATLLGNDFIERRLLRKFYSHVRVKKGKKQESPQQRRIATIFEWLRNESLKSALNKVVGVMKEKERDKLLWQIKTAMNGYSSEKSKAYEFFGFDDKADETTDDLIELLNDSIETEETNEQNIDAEDEDVESGEEIENNDETNEEEGEEEDEEQQIMDEGYEEIESAESVQTESYFPDWLKERFSKAELPRFFADLYKSRRYVNYPQVEDMTLEDSNELAYPILLRIYAALYSPRPPPTLWYMTRVQRYARFYYKKFENVPANEHFDPVRPKNLAEFKSVFKEFQNCDDIFNAVKELPEQIQLYALAIIFWMSKSKLTTSIHLHTILLALIVTFIIDRKFEVTHDETKYQKNYSKLLGELKENFKVIPDKSLDNLLLSNIVKMVTKHEAILCMEKLITYFTVSDKFERKHADFNRSIVHCYAELQSVCFFFYSYNALCNYPFFNIRMSNFYNGFFIYNLHTSLKGRSDISNFLATHVFKFAPHIHAIHCKLFSWCKNLLPKLELFDKQRLTKHKPKINGNDSYSKRTIITKLRQQHEAKLLKHDCNDKKESDEDSSSEFVDMNNKFYQLLKLN